MLVVDDEFDIRELLVDTILDTGLEVIEASDGKSALERIATDHLEQNPSSLGRYEVNILVTNLDGARVC